MKKAVLKFKTIVLSDIHLGAPSSKVDEVNHFLKHTYSPMLILNGDIIDAWSLRRQGGWTKRCTRTIRLVLKKLEKKDTEVIYLRGNHDDVLDRFLPLVFDRLQIVDEYILEAIQGRYLVVHGDVFDAVTQNSRFIAVIGDIGYQSLLKINRLYNKYRAWRGKEYFSLSKAIKARVKQAVSYISRFEDNIETFAHKRNCTGFICGHIHTPADKMVGDVHYLNSGDWVESLTALVEHEDGRWEVLFYPEFCRRLHEEAVKRSELTGKPVKDGLKGMSIDLDLAPVQEDVDDDGHYIGQPGANGRRELDPLKQVSARADQAEPARDKGKADRKGHAPDPSRNGDGKSHHDTDSAKAKEAETETETDDSGKKPPIVFKI